MRVFFIGCVESSYILLKRLFEINAEVVGVITKSKSDFNSDFTDLKPLCDEFQTECLYVKNINDEESLEFVKSCRPEIAFCFGWSQLIKKDFLDMIPNGTVGFHPAQLPNNRGRHPLIWALVLGLSETASTFFMIDRNADTGDIVSQKKVEIAYDDDARSLYDKIMKTAEKQVEELYEQFENGTVIKISQKLNDGNTWRRRSKSDGQIDWRMSSRSIYNLVRGLTRPYVGAHFVCCDNDIKVWKVQEIITDRYRNIEPGKVIMVHANGWIDIKAGDNIIRVLESDPVNLQIGEYL